MCDDLTARDDDRVLDQRGHNGLTRRQFAAITAAAALAVSTEAIAAGPALSESDVSITTPDGTCDAVFIHPAKGTFPGIVMWPDIAGLREAYKVMARRLAGEGYAVLLVNHYYRSAKAPILQTMAEWRTPEGQAKLKPMIAAITPEGTTHDAKAFVAFLDTQPAVDKARGIGTNGYCMGGPYTVRTAFAVPERVRAAASLHGAALVTDKADSPHLLLAATKASYLFAIAQNDDARSPGDKDALRKAAEAAHRPAEIEVYHADHGWTTLDAPSYDKGEAERAWARMIALFKGL